MDNPAGTLLIGLILFLILGLVFWPEKGAAARWKKSKLYSMRVLIEDTLKHLYDFKTKNIDNSLKSISDHLSITPDETAKFLTKMETMGLVSFKSGFYHLTPEGHSYALRVIRIHRVWEKYLADETSIPETEWHPDAEEKEHSLSPSEADILAAQMGNPLRDPHGDPIPTSSGEVRNLEGIPLTLLKAGEPAKIIHIEDEPGYIYSQISALGLYPGMQIRIIDSNKERVRFTADGEENILAPRFADNITVKPVSIEVKKEDSYQTLSKLSIGEEGVVIGISKLCRGQQRRRLMDFGIVPGSVIKADMRSVSGDPVAYKVRGAKIALRKKHTDQIFIRKNESEIKQGEHENTVS